MGSDLAGVREIYQIQQNRLEEGGKSPNQARAYARTVELIDESGTVDEWKQRMDQEGQWDAMTRAGESDTYALHAEIQEEAGRSDIAEIYRQAAEGLSNNEPRENIDTLLEKIENLEAEESSRFKALRRALEMIFEYSVTSDFFALEKKTMLGTFREAVEELGGIDALAETLDEERFTPLLPYYPEDRAGLMETGREMMTVEITEKDPTQKEEDWLENMRSALKDRKNDMIGAEEKRRSMTAERLFTVDADMDEPGEYPFELFWEDTYR